MRKIRIIDSEFDYDIDEDLLTKIYADEIQRVANRYLDLHHCVVSRQSLCLEIADEIRDELEKLPESMKVNAKKRAVEMLGFYTDFEDFK